MKRVINVMEQLVAQEIERQVQQLPPKVQSFLDTADILGFALNQLPALYATSEEGLTAQQHQGQNKYGNRVKLMVKQAIAVTSNQPFRDTKPLRYETGEEPVERIVERIVEVESTTGEQALLQSLLTLIEQQSVQIAYLCEETTQLRSLLTPQPTVQQSAVRQAVRQPAQASTPAISDAATNAEAEIICLPAEGIVADTSGWDNVRYTFS